MTLQKSGLDYEQYANYTVTVNSTDSGFPPYSVTGSFVVNVKNTNEQPHNISLSENQVIRCYRGIIMLKQHLKGELAIFRNDFESLQNVPKL